MTRTGGGDMLLRKFDHSCLLVEDGDARLLLDPGTLSHGFEDLDGLDGVLITHQHPDHLDVERLLPLLRRNRETPVFTDHASATALRDQGVEATAVREGDAFTVAGVDVRVFGRDHAVIHPDIPAIPNVGFLVGERFFHPGDAWTVPDVPVEVLGLPTAAPWVKGSEAVDYLRAVAPRVAVPIHEALLAQTDIYYGLFDRLKPGGTELRSIDDGAAYEF